MSALRKMTAGDQPHSHLLNDDDEGVFIRRLRNSMKWFPSIPVGSNSDKYYRNFLWFTLLFCIVHASVDAVLAFSTAELGMEVGSNGSFCLYIFYTFSAFVLAKPWLARFGPKHTVAAGLLGMLIYVLSFFLAVAISPASSARNTIWLLGASLGGTGAGLLWTGQGSYYTTNSREYALALQRENLSSEGTAEGRSRLSSLGLDATSSATLATFASLFAFGYLLLETVFKLAATGVYLADKSEGSNSRGWKGAVFGLYTVAALVALIFFVLNVINFKADGRTSIDTRIDSMRSSELSIARSDAGSVSARSPQRVPAASGGGAVELRDISKHHVSDISTAAAGGGGGGGAGAGAGRESLDTVDLGSGSASYAYEPSFSSRTESHSVSSTSNANMHRGRVHADLWLTIKQQSTDVAYALYNSSKLRYLMPYQIMFGFISGFLNAYINARYVAVYLGVRGYEAGVHELSGSDCCCCCWMLLLILTLYTSHHFKNTRRMGTLVYSALSLPSLLQL